jgi:hypothetical protein
MMSFAPGQGVVPRRGIGFPGGFVPRKPLTVCLASAVFGKFLVGARYDENLVDRDPLSGMDFSTRTENGLRDTSLPSDNSAGACAPNRRLGADWLVAGAPLPFCVTGTAAGSPTIRIETAGVTK